MPLVKLKRKHDNSDVDVLVNALENIYKIGSRPHDGFAGTELKRELRMRGQRMLDLAVDALRYWYEED